MIELAIKLAGKLNTIEAIMYQSRRERIKHDPIGMDLLFDEAESTVESQTHDPELTTDPSSNDKDGDKKTKKKSRGKRKK